LKKEQILNHLKEKIYINLHSLNEELESLVEDKTRDTKSSAGDKFETSREMIQQSEKLISSRISELRKQMEALDNLPLKECNKIEFGALAHTNNGVFLFGIGGSIFEIENLKIIPISFGSPLGNLFKNKTLGDIVSFNSKQYTITSIQ
jgi:hypothetical protein